ncbi:MAG: CIA30 family protein [Pseudomonadota bacterium]
MFFRSLLLLVMASTASAKDFVLVEFAESATESGWRIVNDTVMGGRSNSNYVVHDGALWFSGYLNTNGGGFASVRGPRLAVPDDSFDRVRLRVRGDGRRYQCRLEDRETGTTYRADFATRANEWVTVELPLREFQATWRGRRLDRPPLSADRIGSLGLLLADGVDGAFKLALARAVLSDGSKGDTGDVDREPPVGQTIAQH